MHRPGTFAMLALLSGLGVGTAFANPSQHRALPVDGVYKKLAYHEGDGDLLGMAVEVHAKGTRIIVTTCEGGCGGGLDWPIQAGGSGFSFTTCDPLLDAHGNAVPCKKVAYTGKVLRDGSLVVQVAGVPETNIILAKIRNPKPNEVRKLACTDGCKA